MSLQITLTDQHLRVSPEFINFLFEFTNKTDIESDWFDQLSENLNYDKKESENMSKYQGQQITNPVIQKAIERSYNLTISTLVGATELIKQIQDKFKFIVVTGCPRSGGSYLTKQLFIALGKSPEKIPGLIAHDGFPKAWPFSIGNGNNEYTNMTRYMAEFLTMIELFYENSTQHEQKIVVPKKDSNIAYYGAFFSNMLGANTEYLVTIRHPITSCISCYEKSGGYPKDGKFMVRSNIEMFIERDNKFVNNSINPIESDYFDMFLHYWEQYYYNIALTGITGLSSIKIIPYTADALMSTAQQYHSRFNNNQPVEEFKIFDKRDRHPEWVNKAEKSIRRIESVWKEFGLEFPTDEIMECW